MEPAEPSLFPQWYKGAGANGSRGIAVPTGGSAPRSEGQGLGLFPRNKVAVGERILPSSKGTGGVNGSGALSDPYRNFGASRRNFKKREVESRGEALDVREIRDRDRDAVPLVENRFDVSSKLNRLRRPDSTVGGRQVDLGAKKTGGEKRTSVAPRGNVVGNLAKSFFEKDFPSLEEKKRDVDRVSSHAITTAGHRLSKGSSTGTVDDHARQIPKAVTGLSMAEKLVQEPRVRSPPQIDVDNQRIEELNLSKIKRLVPLTPVPKSSVLKPSEKSKPNGTRGNLNGPPKVGHHSSSQLVNHGLRGPVRPDVPKLSQPGNFQILTRDMNVIHPSAKELPTVNASKLNNVSTANKVVSSTSAVADVSLSGPMCPKVKADGKQTTLSSAQSSFRDRKVPSQAQKRSAFFNDIRKKTSMNISAGCEPSSVVSSLVSGKSGEQSTGNGVIPSAVCESSSVVPLLSSGKSGELNDVSISSGLENNNYPASYSAMNCSTEIGKGVNSSAGCDSTSAALLLGPGKSGELSTGSILSSLEDINHPAPNSSISYSTENGNGVAGGLNVCHGPEIYISDNVEDSYPEPAIDAEKEAALLKLFGWEEDAREEALTPEEISTFLKKYEKQTSSLKLPQLKFHVLMADLLRKGVGDRVGGGSAACAAEA